MFNSGAINLANPVNKAAPLNRGLVHWWLNVDNKASIRLLDINSGNDVTVPWDRRGLRSPCGFSSLLRSSTTPLSLLRRSIVFSGGRTVAFWYRSTIAISASDGVAIGGGQGVSYYPFIDDVNMYIRSSAGFSTFSSHGMTANNWYYIVIAGNGANANAYINGLKKGSTVTDRNATISTIGSYSNNTFKVTGYMNDIRYYTRELTQAEAINLYRASRTGYTDELNRIDRPWLVNGAGAATTGNRRRRILMRQS